MSYYVYGGKMSYQDYLTARSFVKDITSATRDSGHRISVEVSRQTREVIASNEALARDNIRAIGAANEELTDALSQGFEQLSYHLQDVSDGISELNATFDWAYGQMMAGIGRMNDALSELIKIAKTPAQTAAYEQYEIARDAFRQGLYVECLESLDKAISGDHASPGYKLEWRFHQMKGTIRLGFADGDLALIDHRQAEDSFLHAARYAKTDYPEHAGQAFLSAGWAAYCQGKMKEALAHTEQAIAIHPRLGEAIFQAAKVRMAMGDVDAALPLLSRAIDLDRFYALKAAGDGDFRPYDQRLRAFLGAIREEKYQQSVPLVRAAIEKLRFWQEHSPDALNNEVLRRIDAFFTEGIRWPLIDILAVVQGLPQTMAEIEERGRVSIIIKTEKLSSVVTLSRQDTYPVEETYQVEVVIKPGGLFRKAVTETQTKTRTVMKTRDVKYTLAGVCDVFYQGLRGEMMGSIEFCLIPAGTFMMGDKKKHDAKSHQVTISKDFFLAKYPVTQDQWEMVMGNNPSQFKAVNCPVEGVSWDDCQAFIERLNGKAGVNLYRLPTEAEWEYACRAGSTTRYFFGDSEESLHEYAWYGGNCGRAFVQAGQTQPVGLKRPNAWGLYDMYGNVSEWCQDWYGDYPTEHETDPRGPSSGRERIKRGGSCNDHDECSSACRDKRSPDTRVRTFVMAHIPYSYPFGLRLARMTS